MLFRKRISNNCFNLSRLLSQFVLSCFARHKLRQYTPRRLSQCWNVAAPQRDKKWLRTIMCPIIRAELINVDWKTNTHYVAKESVKSSCSITFGYSPSWRLYFDMTTFFTNHVANATNIFKKVPTSFQQLLQPDSAMSRFLLVVASLLGKNRAITPRRLSWC